MYSSNCSSDSSETFIPSVTPVQDAPVAVDDTYDNAFESGTFIVTELEGVLINDTDVDGDNLTAVLDSMVNVSNGTLTLDANGSFTYTHDGSETTEDSFTYSASDAEGRLLSDPATVYITITPVNDAPVAAEITVTTDEDVAATVLYVGTDIDNNDALLTYEVVTQPINGSVSGDVYTPNANFNGTDSFTYRAFDGEDASETASVTFTINPVNDAPTAINGDISLNENSEILIDYSTIVNDVDEDSLIIIIVSQPNYGNIEDDTYTPDPGFSGTDLLVFEAFDGVLPSNQASITLTVINVNDPPVAFDQDQYLDEDDSTTFVLFGSDPDGDDLTFNLVGQPDNGTATIIGSSVTYIPNSDFFGEDTVHFVANDDSLSSEEGIVTMHVVGTNDPPTATDFEFEEADSYDFSDLANDPDGDVLTLTSVPPGVEDDGTLITLEDGVLTPIGDYEYTYSHPDSIPDGDVLLYKASDGISETDVHAVIFNFNGTNGGLRIPEPSALDDNINIAEDETKVISLFGFDALFDWVLDESSVITIIDQPEHGSLSTPVLSDSSDVDLAIWLTTYQPDLNFYGTDEFAFTVENSGNENGVSDPAFVSIVINAINDTPALTPINDQ